MMSKADRVATLLSQTEGLNDVAVEGWVRTKRGSGSKLSFLEVNDGSTVKNIQVIVNHDQVADDALKCISTGASVRVEGDLVESPASGQAFEIIATSIVVHGTADSTYPLQKKRHSLEFLRTIPHLRIRSNLFGSVFRVRNAISYAIHRFLQEKHFMWVHTPLLTTSDCEGAGDMFQVTTFDLANVPLKEGQVDHTEDFFGKPVFLTVSGQLALETYCSCFKGVYSFGPTFRSEDSNTSRHLSEFWMIEPEIAFADLDDDFELAAEFLKYVITYVLDNCANDMDLFDQFVHKGLRKDLTHVVETPFEKIEYTDAIKALSKHGKSFEYPVFWGCNLQAEHERFLTEKVVEKPVAVMNYPREIKAFYMTLNKDEKTVAAMDVLVPRIGEVIGGSQREHRLDVLEARIREGGMDVEDYRWYLDLRRWGTVRHAGFGIGLERLVQYVTGVSNIRDVIPYPRAPKQAEF